MSRNIIEFTILKMRKFKNMTLLIGNYIFWLGKILLQLKFYLLNFHWWNMTFCIWNQRKYVFLKREVQKSYRNGYKIWKNIKTQLIKLKWSLGFDFPVKKVPNDFPDFPQTGFMLDATNFSMTIWASKVEDLIMLKSHLKASNIFSGVFGMELEW